MDISVSSESGVVDLLFDATDTLIAAISGEADVAVITPFTAPRVADDEVLDTILHAVTNSTHA